MNLKGKKAWVFVICALALSLSLAGCDLQTSDDEMVSLAELEITGEPSMSATAGVKPSVSAQYPTANAAGVPISDYYYITFSEDMNAATFTSSTVKVVRSSDGVAVACRYAYNATTRTLTIKPISKFSAVTNNTTWTGIKPNSTYSVQLSTGVKDVNGDALDASSSYFSTADLDYGFYAMNADGECEKFVSGRANSFFDKTKPTVIWIHGWESDSTAKDYWRENGFFINSKYITSGNTIGTWRNKGWNVVVFFWGQFSDEGEVKDAEAKVWLANNDRKKMRYRIADGSYRTYLNNTKNMTDLIYAEYLVMMNGYSGSDVRVLGHSLGNQLATRLCITISNNVYSGAISSTLMPKRLVLLDPFWGKNAATYAGNQWTGAVCRTYLDTMLKRNAIAFEQFKSSALGGAVADENLDMRKKAVFSRIWPDFIGIIDQGDQHGYANAWYCASIASTVSGGSGYYLGAAATNAQIKAQSNWNYSTGSAKSSVYYWYSKSGKSTATTSDDVFVRASGVSCW